VAIEATKGKELMPYMADTPKNFPTVIKPPGRRGIVAIRRESIYHSNKTPVAIFVNGMDSAPLAADPAFAVQGRKADVQAGVDLLQKLCSTVFLALRAGGSLDGLSALAMGEAMAAAMHLRDPDTGAFNEPAARDTLARRPMVGIVWAWRSQGLILPAGNPRGIQAIPDLARPGISVVGRQPRAGSHVLLVHLLGEAGIRLDGVRFLPEPALAEEAVTDLAELFRAALRESRERIPLGEELEVARTYCRMESLRLGARLAIDWDIDALPLAILVPPLTLQPLLENAVYHGIEGLAGGGRIGIRGRREGRLAVIEVTNPHAGGVGSRTPGSGSGIGLANVRERLQLTFPGEGGLDWIDEGGRFCVTLRFPTGSST
jgi:hypothetical protein